MMVTCEASTCKKRFYSFLRVDGKYQVELGDYDLKNADPAVKTKAKASTMDGRQRAAAVAAIAAALGKLENDGDIIADCTQNCRCPDIAKPPLGKAPWPDDDDTAKYHTSFMFNGVTYVIWFTVRQKFVDIERGCVLNDKEISLLVPDDPIADLIDWSITYSFRPTEILKIEPGVTRIHDVYSTGEVEGRRVLLACQDRRHAIIYVAPNAHVEVKHHFKMRENAEGKWIISNAREKTEYTVKPLEQLNMDQPIEIGGQFF
jgi:hypothetical protein